MWLIVETSGYLLLNETSQTESFAAGDVGTVKKEYHPTSLDGYRDSSIRRDEKNKNKENDKWKTKVSSHTITSGCTKFKAEVISLNVVPITISHPSSSLIF